MLFGGLLTRIVESKSTRAKRRLVKHLNLIKLVRLRPREQSHQITSRLLKHETVRSVEGCTVIPLIIHYTNLQMDRLREHLVYVQRMPRCAATSMPQLRHAFGSLAHLRHAVALPWSSSAFWVKNMPEVWHPILAPQLWRGQRFGAATCGHRPNAP